MKLCGDESLSWMQGWEIEEKVNLGEEKKVKVNSEVDLFSLHSGPRNHPSQGRCFHQISSPNYISGTLNGSPFLFQPI